MNINEACAIDRSQVSRPAGPPVSFPFHRCTTEKNPFCTVCLDSCIYTRFHENSVTSGLLDSKRRNVPRTSRAEKKSQTIRV
ncbi:hypothetical protein ANTRET_LOCUS6489 [Anthophora retusa]